MRPRFLDYANDVDFADLARCPVCGKVYIQTPSLYFSCPGPQIHGKLIPEADMAHRLNARRHVLMNKGKLGADILPLIPVKPQKLAKPGGKSSIFRR